MFIREFRIAGNTLPHLRTSLDLRAILMVHEVDPRRNTDKAKCFIETNISAEPLFLADSYDDVRDAWLGAIKEPMPDDEPGARPTHLSIAKGDA